MPTPNPEPIVNPCPNCGQGVDATSAEPFATLTCPACQQSVRVRRTFNHFEIVREIGVGGMSRVFEAEDTALGRRVALKILNRECSQDAVRLSQFEREARLTANFSHPHIVKVYSVGRDQGYLYIAMEHVPQGSLDERIRSTGAQPEEATLALAIQLVQGLRAAHAAGLIHRDIKPGNILFAEDGGAKIVDFGLALVQGRDVDESTEMWATPFYVPPEKLDGEPDTYRGDMYSLGASLFHALAGKPPCTKDTGSIEELRRIKSFPVHLRPVAPKVSEETCAIIDRLLGRKPEHRYRTYDDLIEHFDFAQKRLASRPTRKLSKRVEWWHRHGPRLGAAAAVVLGLVLGAIFLSNQPAEINSRPDRAELAATPDQPEQSTTARFLEARAALMASDSAKARTLFEEIGRSSGTQSPTRQWAWFNAGIAALLAGDLEGARTEFAAISLEGWQVAPEDRDLAAFFSAAESVLGNPGPLPEAAASRFENSPFQIAAWLPLGLRSWEEGKIDRATRFFESFRNNAPPPALNWLQEYSALIKPHVADIEAGRPMPALDADVPLAEAKSVGEKAAKVIASLRLSRGLKPQLETALGAYRKRIAERERAAVVERAEQAKRLARDELARVDVAGNQARALRGGYRFQEAADLLKRLELTTGGAKQKRDDLVYLWQSAEDFLRQIGEDLNQRAMAGPVERPALPSLGGPIVRASREKWTVRTGATEQTVDVASVPPAHLISMAEWVVDQTADSDAYYRRRESIVAFARVCELPDYARVAAEALTRESRSFRERWARLAQSN